MQTVWRVESVLAKVNVQIDLPPIVERNRLLKDYPPFSIALERWISPLAHNNRCRGDGLEQAT